MRVEALGHSSEDPGVNGISDFIMRECNGQVKIMRSLGMRQASDSHTIALKMS